MAGIDDRIDESCFPPRSELERWIAAMQGFGPRLTGNAAHAAFVRFLQQELENIGLEVHRDTTAFTRWECRAAALHGADGDPIPVSSAYPYSGSTGPQGIEAELSAQKPGPGLKGRIALVEAGNAALPQALIFRTRRGSAKLPFLTRNPVVGGTLGTSLKPFREAGARGVLFIWNHISEENAAGQYLPFTSPWQDLPALWVGPAAGRRLRAMAGERVRLTLDALREPASSGTIFACLPGRDEKNLVIINTHTDGPNAYEENGPAALLALANYFSRIPVSRRRYGLLFLMVTGHFQLPQFGVNGQASGRWLQAHREFWEGGSGKKAVAGITLEHLGAREWQDRRDFSAFEPTGRNEAELVYTGNRVMTELYRRTIVPGNGRQQVMLKPSLLYFGEGEPLFHAGIPTISLVPAPQYLCAEGGIEKISLDLMERQIRDFAGILHRLDEKEPEALGTAEKTAGEFLSRLLSKGKNKEQKS
jgi:hypothetical protein